MAYDPEQTPKTLRQLQKETPSSQEIIMRLAKAQQANDYEAAMMSASLLEFTMKQAILTKFIPLGNDKVDEIFEDSKGGLLSTFSSKIKMIYALGIVTSETRSQFDRLRLIRNHFAHHHNFVAFENPEVARECLSLKQIKILMPDAKSRRELNLTPKLRYVQTCIFGALYLSEFMFDLPKEPLDLF